VNRNQLLDGCTLTCAHRLSLTYEFDEDAITGECEFEGDSKRCKFKKQSHQEGTELWTEALGRVETPQPVAIHPPISPTTTTKDDFKMQSTLEEFAEDALLCSDAAFLEDLQGGLPLVSGACLGFGFDMTGDGDHHRPDNGKLRLHEKSRP
jgi:hypothetical protein